MLWKPILRSEWHALHASILGFFRICPAEAIETGKAYYYPVIFSAVNAPIVLTSPATTFYLYVRMENLLLTCSKINVSEKTVLNDLYVITPQIVMAYPSISQSSQSVIYGSNMALLLSSAHFALNFKDVTLENPVMKKNWGQKNISVLYFKISKDIVSFKWLRCLNLK